MCVPESRLGNLELVHRARKAGFMMSKAVVFLFDVDNTLLDNDRVSADLKQYLANRVGEDHQRRYWALFEELRTELGYADYLGALQRYRTEYPRDPNLLAVSEFLIEYHFANRLFPNSLDVLEHVAQWGQPVILSDGDVVFQPAQRSDDRDCLMRSTGMCSFMSTKNTNSKTFDRGTQRIITCWWTIRCAFSPRSRKPGATA